MKTIMITQARQDLYNIVNEAIESSVPVQIVGKRGGAVLISVDDWNAIQETLYLSSIVGFEESLIKADEDEWIPEEEADW